MQKAKAAAASFLSKDGKHKTTMDQDVNAAVTEEHVKPHEHEKITTAVDREVHQDHHQTRIQPVDAKETRPETSEHVMEPTVHKSFEHTNEAEERQKLDAERAAFHNSSVTHDTTHSTDVAPAITGERVHHHVHEHIQPVIHKDTIAPHVVHKTVPVHETHHAAPVHHEVTTLPAKTLEEFQSAGGTLQGENMHVTREHEGCPGPYNKDCELPSTALGSGHSHQHSTSSAGSGVDEYTTSRESGLLGTSPSGAAGASATDRTPRTGENLGGTTSGTSGTGERHKPSLKEKFDPRVDADSDGKKGVFS
ncbi:uncharacterized protein J7T54_002903 [Emericellopsis cladophorae]|uniref:Allergen n=1 Tax=Emericellopsis cladophorae TaxID=2686198 RepID=A0A9P9XWC8_9HYPO|nr:uncharacterized protein J7T54_002903 [Emericellopsis cladophorae]KAI6778635.1 hypothetical protein J7T54_002903 [Emericellopsis cladophorae]